jgi:hypothetical protein
MLSAVTEDKASENEAKNYRDDIAAIRDIGGLIAIAGMAVAVIMLVAYDGTPPPLVIATALVATVGGVGMRIEAAIREHRRP